MKRNETFQGWNMNNNGFRIRQHEIGNNANIGISGFATWKQNIPVRIEPRPLINL